MSKRFKDVNVGDKLYFITSNSDGVALSESRVEDIKYEKNLVNFVNDVCYCGISIDSYINDNSVSIKHENSFIAVYTEQEYADTCYASLIEKNREKNCNHKENKTSCCDCDCEESSLRYTKEDLNKMSGKEFQEALDNMSLYEMIYHGLETVKDIFGGSADECNDSEGENLSDVDRDNKKPNYPIPSSDAIVKKINSDKLGLNKDGGLDSVNALLAITVTGSGIYELDEEHFDGVNPLFQGPRMYFHSIAVPNFREDADEESVDVVYRAIEKWIYETYPEFECLEYGEDWHYDLLRAEDYSVENTEVDFNIFK